ncbi:FliO/MopB family protein [Caldithrix abyssi]
MLTLRKILGMVCVIAVLAATGAAQTQTFFADTSAQMSDSTVPAAQQFEQTPSLTGHYIKLLLITFVLLGALYLILRILRKLQYGNTTLKNEPIRVLSKTYLSSKHSLWVVIVGRNKYLLGVTDHSINLIDNLGPAAEEELLSASPGALPSFGNLLDKIKRTSS